MKQARSFGVRGMTAEERAAANPYMGRKFALGGEPSLRSRAGTDDALRDFMLAVYNYMFLGLMVTAAVAAVTYMLAVTGDVSAAGVDSQGYTSEVRHGLYLTSLGQLIFNTPISYAVCFGPIVVLLFAGGAFRDLDPVGGMIVYMIVAVLIGISFGAIGIVYTGASLAQVFAVTAAMFAGLSLFGYTTGKDLSGWGAFLWMGFLGLLLSIIVNIFLQSAALEFAFCTVGVIVFAGFTAYDTQMIRDAYSDRLSESETKGLAISGAVDLYLDFVNLFRFMLYFLGSEEE